MSFPSHLRVMSPCSLVLASVVIRADAALVILSEMFFFSRYNKVISDIILAATGGLANVHCIFCVQINCLEVTIIQGVRKERKAFKLQN